MFTANEAPELLDRVLLDAAGDKVGTVTEVYLDDQTGAPSWLTVRTGWFGSTESFVPLDRVDRVGTDLLRTPYDKTIIKNAPRHDTGQPLSESDEDELYSYYGLNDLSDTGRVEGNRITADSQDQQPANSERPAVPDTGESPVTAPADGRPAGRPRLRKYVVTEQETVTVALSHQEARIERIPIPEADRDLTEPGTFTEEERAVVLHAERPVVTTEVVPVERARLVTDPGHPQ